MKFEPGSRYFHEPNGWLARPEIAIQLSYGCQSIDNLQMLDDDLLCGMRRAPGLVENGEAPEVDVDDDISSTEDLSLQSPLFFVVVEDGRRCRECDCSSLGVLLFLS